MNGLAEPAFTAQDRAAGDVAVAADHAAVFDHCSVLISTLSPICAAALMMAPANTWQASQADAERRQAGPRVDEWANRWPASTDADTPRVDCRSDRQTRSVQQQDAAKFRRLEPVLAAEPGQQ